ncbi:MAG: PAS domain S-box protein, partial [Nitrospira sp.]|nr:PAS domain S-box protein [Nitrospira sp.]
MMLTHLDIAVRLKLFSKLTCWIAIFTGVLVLLGWILGDTARTIMVPFLVSMKPNAALALILSGTALRVLQDDVRWPRARLIAWACAAATATIGLLTSVEYVIDWNGGLDEWLFEDSPGDVGMPMPGRMGLNTALCFLSIGLALLVLDNHFLGPYVSQTLTIVAMGNACAAPLGHAYQIESLYGTPPSTPMALHSSIALIAMGAGIFCARPKQGWMALLISDRIGSQVARRLLPAAILVPFVNGLLEVQGKRLGFYDEALGAALITTSGIMVFGVLIWWTATSLNRVDQQRRFAEHKRDLYQNMFVHSKDGIVVMDTSGYYLEQNPQHEQLLGYGSGELIGQTPALILGESDFARIADDLSRTGMSRGEALCRTKSGKHIPFDLSSFSVKDEHGQVVCHVCIKRDMTDRKRSEQILREAHDELEQRVLERTSALMKTNEALKTEVAERKRAEQALQDSWMFTQAILDSLTAHIAVIDRDGAIDAVNEAWTKSSHTGGARAEETGVGMNYLDICRRVSRRDARLAKSMADTIRAILDGTPISASAEYEYACELDSDVRWFLITIVPYRGRHAGAVISHFDITERKRAEEALRESEGRFRAIFNQASIGIAEVRPDGRFLRVNAKLCDIMGRQEDVLLKMTFQELTHPDDLPQNLACLQQTLDGQRDSCSIEKRYLRADGMDVWCRLSVSLVRTSAGSPKHFISVVEDISERKRTSDALQTIAAATASVTEEDFFRSLVSHLATTWPVRYAFVGELMDGRPQRVRMLAMWAGSDYDDNIIYGLEGTPCEQVIQQRVTCFYPHGVQRRFPTDTFLADRCVESYYGVPLLDRGGHILGLLAVMHDQPLSLLPGMEQMLLIFGARAGMELERKRTLEALRFSDQALRQLIDERE